MFSKLIIPISTFFVVMSVVCLPVSTSAATISSNSYNWAGYEVTRGTFTGVTGTWRVPAVPESDTTKADVTWVGIGGVTTSDLVQAGTQALVSGSGVPSYEAWYEVLPDQSQDIPMAVSAGDILTVTIMQRSSGSWVVAFRNDTTGQSYQTTLDYDSSLSSAEWVQEMPSDGTNLIPLDNFGRVFFANCFTIQNGQRVSISASGADAVTMIDHQGDVLAAPSPLGLDGASFSVSRT